ncbi:hypothetical protein ELH26_07905 [Rhizobium leguminosarum]|uniref:hypothetical protein n=1 Tax=Rhizobium TaxID=379 RepID=UPI0010304CA9|nr:hypothetical protein [Rhizobium leguminosarum]NKL64103.1 hypothetical protein [Rhizobium leguminosarum bv. viciae]TAU52769.1 hypothetical protein ELI43_08080 [Rhizobium leguminosarum]TBC93949.1 hypothetical protein ELH26_07905 [Rhizobium leguminosarum]
MTSISPANHSAALTVLKQAWPPSGSALNFLSSAVFKASSTSVANAIAAAFTSNGELQKVFSSRYEAVMESAARKFNGISIHPDNGRHNALADTIIANRESFPPEEFTIHTDLPDGASITTIIPSAAAMKGETFKKWVQEKQSSFDAAQAAKEATLDNTVSGTAAVAALSQIVETVVLNTNKSRAQMLLQATSVAQEDLAKPYLNDD